MAQHIPSRGDEIAGNDKSFGNCFFAGLEIAEILAGLKLDSDSLVAGILCRAVREERLALVQVEADFGSIVAKLIDGVQQMDAITAVQQPLNTSGLGGHN